MKYYAHNIGDWLPATVQLSNTQEGVYRRLMDWYYSNELPLPVALAECNRIVRARNQGDRDAVKLILARYFIPAADGWHHQRIDRELESYALSLPMRTAKRDANADRQRRSRQKRDASWAALVSRGIQTPFKASQSQLDELMEKHGVTLAVTRDEQRDLGHTRGINNQEPRSVTPYGVTPVVTRDTAAAARALKAGGFPMAQANLADPRFIALLQAGVGEDELRLTASEAVSRSKSWGWLLATLAGRHADVANGFVSARPLNARAETARERVAALTPSIAAKPANPL